jgi:two-component system sensor histidine kinase UhpB
LHDDLTQRLAAVAIDAGRLQQMAPDPLLDRIKQQMAELSRDVHGMSKRLHPSALHDQGLVAAVESECRAFFERGGAPVKFDYDPEVEGLPRETQLGLYRIVQEALRNISRHAAANEVEIELGKTMLRVKDNGRGFEPAARLHSGLGLSSMDERARILGGRLHVHSAPGEGTEIRVELGDGKA